MDIPYSGSLTKEEFKDLVTLGQRPILKKSSAFIDIWIILLVLGVSILLTGLWTMFTAENVPGSFVFIALGVVVLIFSGKFRKAVDQAWEQYKKTDLRREGRVTDHYFEIRNSTGNAQVFWTGISGYGEYRNVLVLFQGQVGYPFSARFFRTETDWQEFRKFVMGKFPMSHRVPEGLNLASNWYIWLLIIIAIIGLIILQDSK